MAGEAKGVGGLGGPAPLAGKAGRPRAGFSLGSAGAAAEDPASAQVSATHALSPLFGLLALQENETGKGRDQAAQRRADALLEELSGLQLEMLGGGMDPARLERLARLGQGDAGADPALREVVEAIALRAQLELARRGMGSGSGRA